MTARPCRWCSSPLEERRVPNIYCSKKCRQSAWRLRRLSAGATGPASGPGNFVYADPPYPGMAHRYYSDHEDYAGEVDHRELIRSLVDARHLGWALSTSSKALRDVLPLCPPGARVAAWVKPIGVPPATNGIHSTWEPVIVVGGRQRQPGVRDWLRAQPARGGGTLPGRKPIAFCAWLFDLLGMQPGDTLIDMFPGTGIVATTWRELSSRTSATGRWLPAPSDTSLTARADPSSTPRGDGLSPSAPNDPSLLEQRHVAGAGVGDVACEQD